MSHSELFSLMSLKLSGEPQ